MELEQSMDDREGRREHWTGLPRWKERSDTAGRALWSGMWSGGRQRERGIYKDGWPAMTGRAGSARKWVRVTGILQVAVRHRGEPFNRVCGAGAQ